MSEDFYARIAMQYGVDAQEVKREISNALSESEILCERRDNGLFRDCTESERIDMTLFLLTMLSYNELVKANFEIQENMYKAGRVKGGREAGKQARFA